MPVETAIFPVAGLGTRILPATKVVPKELLPVVDKPILQYAVEEAAEAGIRRMVFVVGRGKALIADHFGKAYELETELERRGRDELLHLVRSVLPKGVACLYVRQEEPLGLGHAVLCARSAAGNGTFAVVLPDDLIWAERPVLQQMVEVFEEYWGAVVAVEPVPQEETGRYGIVAPKEQLSPRLSRISALVEKPAPEEAPSRLAIVGRYLLPPDIWPHLADLKPGAGGELQLTDAIAALLKTTPVYAYRFEGVRYDCGTRIGYLKAQVDLGLKHPEVGPHLAHHLKGLFGSEGSHESPL